MFKRFTFFIATRYTGGRQHSQLVSFISGLSMAGLIVGVSLLLVVLSVMNGFDRELREKILGVMPHGSVMHQQGIKNWQQLSQKFEQHPSIIATAPFVQRQAMVMLGQQVSPVNIYGVDPEKEARVSVVNNFLEGSSLESLLTVKNQHSTPVVLGKGVADSIGAVTGETITLILPGESSDSFTRAPKLLRLYVAGVFNTGSQVDNQLVLVHLADLLPMANNPGLVDGIRIKVDNLFHAPNVIHQLVYNLDYGFFAVDWTRTHGNLFHAIQMSKKLVGLLVFLIIAIAAFNVVSTLVMVVIDKQGDIAILRTLGASTREILSVFILQGSLIGFMGTLIGIAVGIALSLGITQIVSGVEALLGIDFLKSDIYPLTDMPSDIRIGDIVAVALTAMSMSFLASLYPALRAAKVQPADALRFE